MSVKLQRFEWQGIFKPLKNEDVQGLDQYNELIKPISKVEIKASRKHCEWSGVSLGHELSGGKKNTKQVEFSSLPDARAYAFRQAALWSELHTDAEAKWLDVQTSLDLNSLKHSIATTDLDNCIINKVDNWISGEIKIVAKYSSYCSSKKGSTESINSKTEMQMSEVVKKVWVEKSFVYFDMLLSMPKVESKGMAEGNNRMDVQNYDRINRPRSSALELLAACLEPVMGGEMSDPEESHSGILHILILGTGVLVFGARL
ncbi:hypothetical protein ARMSODRAFT_972129 [Armillaria solidipes]|uniref:Uncharacterized protein n=1 Tax=Armillaria solidipes TaxID=1076256 RepID=A0A2H3BS83_9AGAR|nr:hypothetical protein ARMSODRAFT_972129 [Armillaria solidipes]